MSLQVTVTHGDPEKPVEIIVFADPPEPYHFTDVDGDRIAVFSANIPGVGPGVNFRTSPSGCSVPAAEIEAFIQAVRDAVAAAGPAANDA